MRSPFSAIVAATVAVAALGACTRADASGDPDAEIVGMPPSWLASAAAGWPASDAFGGSIPVLSRTDDCAVDQLTDPLGAGPKHTDVGWGSFGDDTTALDSYRHLCKFWAEDRYSGQLQLIQTSSSVDFDALVELFTTRPSSNVQDVSHGVVDTHGVRIEVTSTWYPTNPQGMREALYVDPESGSALVLEVNSLSEEDYATFDEQAAAEELARILALGQ